MGDFYQVDRPDSVHDGLDLRKCDLRGSDFRRSSFRRTDLRGAKFCGANLQRACLVGARFKGADLRWCDFRNANLTDTDLALVPAKMLHGANLRGAALPPGDFNVEDNAFLFHNVTGVPPSIPWGGKIIITDP